MTMTIEQAYEALQKLDGGADILAAFKAEATKLRNEAKTNRIAKEDILKQLGIDGDKGTMSDEIKNLSDLIAKFKSENQNPGDVLTKLSKLETDLADLTKKYEDEQKKATEAENKRLDSQKQTELVKALTDGKAVSPTELTIILLSNIVAIEDGTLSYKNGDKELSIKDGVSEYLKANPWAVTNNGNAGGGTTPPQGGNTPDYERMSEADYFKARDAENK